MATHHGATRQPLDRDATPKWERYDVDTVHNYHHEDTGDFETIEQEHHTNLTNLTWELDDLLHRVQAGEGQLTEALHHIECKLQRLSIVLCPSALPEPLMIYFSNTQ